MLCANLFAAQLVFVVGVERTEVEVLYTFHRSHYTCVVYNYTKDIEFTFMCIGCLFSNCCFTSLSVPRGVHVDADGGCGPVRSTDQSVYKTYPTLHHWFHNFKLW